MTSMQRGDVGSILVVYLEDRNGKALVRLPNGSKTSLRGIGAALRPGGHLAFETRRPEYRAWQEWAADTAPVILDVPGAGMVEQRREVTQVSLPFVSFRYTYRFDDGAIVTSDSMLRFRSREEVESSLAAHGYRVAEVRDAPDRPGREFVFIAERLT